MKLLKAEAHLQTISLNVHIASFNVSNHFTGKSDGTAALYEGSA